MPGASFLPTEEKRAALTKAVEAIRGLSPGSLLPYAERSLISQPPPDLLWAFRALEAAGVVRLFQNRTHYLAQRTSKGLSALQSLSTCRCGEPIHPSNRRWCQCPETRSVPWSSGRSASRATSPRRSRRKSPK